MINKIINFIKLKQKVRCITVIGTNRPLKRPFMNSSKRKMFVERVKNQTCLKEYFCAIKGLI